MHNKSTAYYQLDFNITYQLLIRHSELMDKREGMGNNRTFINYLEIKKAHSVSSEMLWVWFIHRIS